MIKVFFFIYNSFCSVLCWGTKPNTDCELECWVYMASVVCLDGVHGHADVCVECVERKTSVGLLEVLCCLTAAADPFPALDGKAPFCRSQ